VTHEAFRIGRAEDLGPYGVTAGYRARLSAIPDWDAANATMLYQVGSNPDALNLIKRDFILTAIIKDVRPLLRNLESASIFHLLFTHDKGHCSENMQLYSTANVLYPSFFRQRIWC